MGKNAFEFVEEIFKKADSDVQEVQDVANRFYELFIMHLKMNDKLKAFKEDYFQ